VIKDNRFYYKLRFFHKDGLVLYPVKIKNRDTGKLSFRLSEGGSGGNKKENGIEIEDPLAMVELVIQKGFAVRLSSLEKKQGLYKINHRSIINYEIAE
jgi:hypothetical protein